MGGGLFQFKHIGWNVGSLTESEGCVFKCLKHLKAIHVYGRFAEHFSEEFWAINLPEILFSLQLSFVDQILIFLPPILLLFAVFNSSVTCVCSSCSRDQYIVANEVLFLSLFPSAVFNNTPVCQLSKFIKVICIGIFLGQSSRKHLTVHNSCS